MHPAAPGFPPPRTSPAAIGALTSALLSFVCLPVIGGILAIALGITARLEIDHSEGRLQGKHMALVSIVLGTMNTFGVALALVFSLLRPAATPVVAPAVPAPAASPSVPAPSRPSAPAPSAAATASSRDEGTILTPVGRIQLVDVGPRVRSLTTALDEQQAEALRQNQKVMLWLVAPDCQPCNGVAAALPDPLIQEALRGVRLVRLDVREFGEELTHLGVPVAREDGTVIIPAFVLMDDAHRALDYVHGGEWDADIARNIAPVLGGFVRGTYKQRRHPWRRGQREEGLPL